MSKPIISALWRAGIALGAALIALPAWSREVEISPLVYEVDDEALTAIVKEPLSNLRGIVEAPTPTSSPASPPDGTSK